MKLNLITEAWLVNERTGGDWMRIGVRIGNECSTELTTDAALAELALAAGSTIEDVMNAMLLHVVRTFARTNPDAIVPVIRAPVIWE